jgi:ADP-heptose:LPS heptosyltransferase
VAEFSEHITCYRDRCIRRTSVSALVISVDTSIVHLAGALAKPGCVLVPFLPDWRWLLDRSDNPWYPTARLFRQTIARDWREVIDRVQDALLIYLNQSSARSAH